MTTTPRIAVVTGSRADYGLLRPLIRALDRSERYRLDLLVTGMHLSECFGKTVEAIERDGFAIAARIESLVDGDGGGDVGRSIARGTAGFADYFENERPDLLVVLGDRYEILAAAVAALPAGIPIAHLCGGDVTEGAYDDSIRHALTKLAHLHFVTNADAERRVIQLGEQPERVHLVGSTGIDSLLEQDLIGRADLAEALGLDAGRRWLLLTFHPVTRDTISSTAQVEELLAALDHRIAAGDEIIVTQPNADNEGIALTRRLMEWCGERERAHFRASLGQQRYASMMAEAAAMVGNSSSGLHEAPTMGCPTVNIGIRQKGRPRAASVIDCLPERAAIAAAITTAKDRGRAPADNPFGDGRATMKIMAVLETIEEWQALLTKPFHDLEPRR